MDRRSNCTSQPLIHFIAQDATLCKILHHTASTRKGLQRQEDRATSLLQERSMMRLSEFIEEGIRVATLSRMEREVGPASAHGGIVHGSLTSEEETAPPRQPASIYQAKRRIAWLHAMNGAGSDMSGKVSRGRRTRRSPGQFSLCNFALWGNLRTILQPSRIVVVLLYSIQKFEPVALHGMVLRKTAD